MSADGAARALKSVSAGRAQQTLAAVVNRSGVGLYLGARATATLLPALAGEGWYFVVEGEETRVAAEVGNVEAQSPLCTTLLRGGAWVRTVEHLLSAMEALGVDNCRVEVSGGNERPSWEGLGPVTLLVEKMHAAGLIKGGSPENTMVCSMAGSWLNPPLWFEDETCCHKSLDPIGDYSLLAQNGNQGFPITHIVAYKAGHALHTNFLRQLSGKITADQEMLAEQD